MIQKFRDKLEDLHDHLHNRWCDWKWKFHNWVFWNLTGFPLKRRCPVCAGAGRRNTETGARYGDPDFECVACRGTGRVQRDWAWLLPSRMGNGVDWYLPRWLAFLVGGSYPYGWDPGLARNIIRYYRQDWRSSGITIWQHLFDGSAIFGRGEVPWHGLWRRGVRKQEAEAPEASSTPPPSGDAKDALGAMLSCMREMQKLRKELEQIDPSSKHHVRNRR